MSSQAVETKKLTKKYADFTAVNNLNLKIKTGTIFGMLGPNGAGKTTMILMLLGLTEPTSGYCKVFGFNPMKEPLKVKQVSGYLPEKIGLYENMTAEENLRYIARLNRISSNIENKRVSEALDKVGLSKQSNLQVNKFSRGMKQRLGIANVLIKKPQIAFLDEPTQGIDPSGVQDVLEILKNMNKNEKVTIIISSHLIHHVQEICDKVGIMTSGRIKVRSRHHDFGWEKGGKWIIEAHTKNITQNVLTSLSNMPEVINVKQIKDLVLIESDRDIRSRISETIVKNNVSLLGLQLRERSLDEIYQIYSRET